MRHSIAFLIFINLTIGSGSAQCINHNNDFFKFYCYGKLDSILLPSDFRGPDYFNYEEGSIIGFRTMDSCLVSILCGANAILQLDSSYVTVDTIIVDQSIKFINFYCPVLKMYARKGYLKKFFIMYENASIFRKQELDKIFDLL